LLEVEYFAENLKAYSRKPDRVQESIPHIEIKKESLLPAMLLRGFSKQSQEVMLEILQSLRSNSGVTPSTPISMLERARTLTVLN
jgi:hypothetical protein